MAGIVWEVTPVAVAGVGGSMSQRVYQGQRKGCRSTGDSSHRTSKYDVHVSMNPAFHSVGIGDRLKSCDGFQTLDLCSRHGHRVL